MKKKNWNIKKKTAFRDIWNVHKNGKTREKGPNREIIYENKAYLLHCNQNYDSKRIGIDILECYHIIIYYYLSRIHTLGPKKK